MPSLDLYKKMLNAKTIGEAHKLQSDMVMEATWDTDINTRTCYLYDFWHDDHKTQLKNLDSPNDAKKIAISLKWRKSSNQTYDKDTVTHHIQMKPSQEMNVDYYPAFFGDLYNAVFPVGLYLDIPDEKGVFNRWLVVGVANYFVSQFPTFEVLPCDYIFDWIYKGKKYKMAGCLRSQNSYNSGIWTDYRISTVEDQQKFVLPLNSLSEKIYYNQRMIIDNKVDVSTGAEPRAWKISKINRINSNGIVLATLAQDVFQQHTDFIEYEIPGDPSSIIGMWADYYVDGEPAPTEDIPMSDIYSKISYSGKAVLYIGGGYKKFTVNFFDGDKEIDFKLGRWEFTLDGDDPGLLVETDIDQNQAKVKFNGSEAYMGKTLTVSYVTTTGIRSSVDVTVTGV